jgi:hypothetical protein
MNLSKHVAILPLSFIWSRLDVKLGFARLEELEEVGSTKFAADAAAEPVPNLLHVLNASLLELLECHV